MKGEPLPQNNEEKYLMVFQPILEAGVLRCHRESFTRFPEQSWQANSLETLDMNLNISLNIFSLNKGKLGVPFIKNYEK